MPTSSITPTPNLPASHEGIPGSFPAFLIIITVAFIVLAIIIFITIKRKQR